MTTSDSESLNITLRAPEPTDLNFLYITENDPVQWRTSLCGGPLSRHQLWNYINNYDCDLTSVGSLYLIIEDADRAEPIGSIEIFDYDRRTRRAFIGIYVVEAYRRRGVARRAMQMAIDMMLSLFNLKTLVAVIAVDNESSQRLFTDLGFDRGVILSEWLRDSTDATLRQLRLQ
jgi:diamine N-acetyltransferase